MKHSFRRNQESIVSRVALWVAAFALSTALCSTAMAASTGDLQVYFIDVEGGQATLFVAPTGESLLIDTGWPGNDSRDANRIAAAAKLAGLHKLDYVLITHFHDDHVGGVTQLAAAIPVGTFIDHGPNRESTDALTVHDWQIYEKFVSTHGHRIIAKTGEKLPLKGLNATIISSDGVLIDKPLAGAGAANPLCAAAPKYAADTTENSRSLGILITVGKLRLLDLGDLTADKETELVCPVNKLGKVDVYIVSHHGWYQSSSPAFVHAIAPRIAIMDNGAKKGGSIPVLDTIRSSPGIEALWQLHYSEEGGAEHNTAAPYIANIEGTDNGNYLKLTANPSGSMEIYNPRTGETKKYAAK